MCIVGSKALLTTMDSPVQIKEDEVSDPLKHLLSLDWKSSETKLKAMENDLEQLKQVKRVRFSDKVEQISYDVIDEKNASILSKLEEDNDDRYNGVEMNDDLSTFPVENEGNISFKEVEFASSECPFVGFENITDSEINDYEINSISADTNAEINIDVDQSTLKFISVNLKNTDHISQQNYADELKNITNELKTEIHDLNEITNQVKSLTLENVASEKIESLSFQNSSNQHSDFNPISVENSVNVEKKSDNSGFSVDSSKKRISIYQKQSWKLKSALTKDSSYSTASELNSAIFKAWCEVKNKTKDVGTIVKSEINASNKPTTSTNAFMLWKKSKSEAFKRAKKDKQNTIFRNMHQEVSKNDKEDIEMAFKSWKKKKDEILKQKIVNKNDEKQISLVDDGKEERKMDAEAAFAAWKLHKEHLNKMEKKRKAFMIQKQKEDENKKNLRDKEALDMYHIWLENKNSPAKHDTLNLLKEKPPWFPPG